MGASSLSPDRRYTEYWATIRATDEISFKLMGLVPLVSGAATVTFLLKKEDFKGQGWLVIALSLFAAVITLGLFRWELRNTQICSRFKQHVEDLELEATARRCAIWPPNPPHKLGKTEAEKVIYSITVLMWLMMPLVLDVSLRNPEWLQPFYVATFAVIAVLTLLSAFESVNPSEPKCHRHRRRSHCHTPMDCSPPLPKNAPVQITKAGSPPSTPEQAEYFTGLVEKFEIIDASNPARVHVVRVRFQPGARTYWHRHHRGQTLVVTEGRGWVQQRGGEIKEMSAGDVVWIPPSVEHWHGATPTETMMHVAVQERNGKVSTEWLVEVTQNEYQK